MAGKKKNAKVVVSQVYFELIERKARLLGGMYGDGLLSVGPEQLKELERLQKAWDKADGDFLAGTEEPYKEPTEKK